MRGLTYVENYEKYFSFIFNLYIRTLLDLGLTGLTGEY